MDWAIGLARLTAIYWSDKWVCFTMPQLPGFSRLKHAPVIGVAVFVPHCWGM
jgi:hypothetical protein